MRRRFFIVFNPAAGRSRRAALGEIIAALKLRGAAVTLNETVSAEASRTDMLRAIEGGGFDAIIAAGGDGTVRQAACVLVGREIPLGYIPLGTGNVLAHELGLDRSAGALAQMLMQGPSVPIELASANGEPFLLMAGMGFDGRVIAALDHRWKSMVGKAAFAIPALRALAAPRDHIVVEIDGSQHSADWVVVANARYYGGHFVIAPLTEIRTSGLSAILFRAKSKAMLAQQLADLALGRLHGRAQRAGGGVLMLSARQVVLTCSRPLPLQIDGDAFGEAQRLEISAAQARIQLIVP